MDQRDHCSLILMAKILNAIKKPAKKVAVKEVKEVAEVVTCEACNGTGLLDKDNLCALCDGSGKK